MKFQSFKNCNRFKMPLFIWIYIFLTIVIVEVSCECGITAPDTSLPITPWGDIKPDIFPWDVYIHRKPSNSTIPKCGGTLISSSVVITAAHCFNRDITGPTLDDLSNFTVYTDRRNPPHISPGRDIQESKIKTLHTALAFRRIRGFYNADIAWIVLEQPFNLTTSVSPVCLDIDNRPDEDLFQTMRGGKITIRRKTANGSDFKFHRMYIAVFPHMECSSMVAERSWSALPDTFCTKIVNVSNFYYNNGGGFYAQHNGRWYLRGVINKGLFSFPNSNPNVFLPLTNVGHFVDEIISSPAVKRCGLTEYPANPLVVKGFTAVNGEFPWHIAVYKRNSTGYNKLICGGSLISSNVVISAAHCFYDDNIKRKEDASNFAVAAGKLYQSYNWPEKYVQKSAVDTIHLSSRYNGIESLYVADIAWLILQRPFVLNQFVSPICLSHDNWHETEELWIGRVGKVAGWGYTAVDSPSNELQEMYAPFVTHNQCVSAVPPDFRPYLTTDKFCAGYLNGTSLCNGDSGGGLVFQRDSRWYLRGVVSVGPRNGTIECNFYTAFVDVGRYFNELHRFTNISPYDLI